MKMETMTTPTQISTRQKAYLDAMGIGVWCLRRSACAAIPDKKTVLRLKLGPGSGGVLLVCAADTDSASRLASDINRVLGNVPVWAWPNADAGAVKLSNAVDENLFSTIAVFGEDLAAQLFDGELPVSLNSANIVMLPAMQDLLSQADARRVLWDTFCRSGMVNTCDHKT
jgi:DNA polymerase III psi subunit